MLNLGAEELHEDVEFIVESLDRLGIGGLLALHGRDDEAVAGSDFLEVGSLVGAGFTYFDTLGEEVVGDGGLDGLGVGFFVDDPTIELMGVFGGVFGELDDLLGGLCDRFVIGMHFSDDVVVGVDATGDLAMSRCGSRCEDSESAESEDGFFHNEGKLAEEVRGAIWEVRH